MPARAELVRNDTQERLGIKPPTITGIDGYDIWESISSFPIRIPETNRWEGVYPQITFASLQAPSTKQLPFTPPKKGIFCGIFPALETDWMKGGPASCFQRSVSMLINYQLLVMNSPA